MRLSMAQAPALTPAALPAVARALLALTAPRPRPPADPVALPELLALAAGHRMLGSLLHGIAATAAWPATDPVLVQARRQRAVAALARVRALHAVAGALSGAGVPYAAIKGPALSMAIYGDALRRDSSDLDVMVPLDRYPDAFAALCAMGAEPGDYALLLACRRVRRRWPAPGAPDAAFRLPGLAGRGVELHWRWSRHPLLPPVDPPRIWGGWRVEVMGRRLAVPDPVEQLIYLCVHGARHQWFRLGWLQDIRMTLHDPGWVGGGSGLEAAAARAAALYLGRPFAEAFLLAAALDGVPPPAAVASAAPVAEARPAMDRMFANLARPRPDNPEQRRWADLRGLVSEWRLRDGWSARHLLWRPLSLLAPSERDLTTLALPGWAGAAYWPLRPLLWAWRSLRRRPLAGAGR
ncbi:MAG: hypothetical protein OHK0024_34830 [Thalassobaculales bacterium]